MSKYMEISQPWKVTTYCGALVAHTEHFYTEQGAIAYAGRVQVQSRGIDKIMVRRIKRPNVTIFHKVEGGWRDEIVNVPAAQ